MVALTPGLFFPPCHLCLQAFEALLSSFCCLCPCCYYSACSRIFPLKDKPPSREDSSSPRKTCLCAIASVPAPAKPTDWLPSVRFPNTLSLTSYGRGAGSQGSAHGIHCEKEGGDGALLREVAMGTAGFGGSTRVKASVRSTLIVVVLKICVYLEGTASD